jgi:hypothetical protein
VEDFGAVGEKFETEDRETKVVCGGIKDEEENHERKQKHENRQNAKLIPGWPL